MMTLAASTAASSSLIWPALISFITSGAFVGIVVAIIKLPSDRAGAAMLQAQGANEALREALEAIERERDYWRSRYESCAQRHAALTPRPDES